ncbi:MAG: aminotransferase class V-fold PLP-dependent enzyme [Desulfobacterales bacterium]|nr:aminotransferase class V-fold PLP-dependent enzyme [Desulfobacterales bacterium]
MKILRVNMERLEITQETLPTGREIIGGRGLTAKILNDEVPPATDPLSKAAKLVIATGPLAGTNASSCGRLSIGAKSPLTHGIKEANVGGPAGQKLDRLGIRAVIIEDEPQDGGVYLLNLGQDKFTLENAAEYKGMKTYDIAKLLREKTDRKATIVSIGLGGERRWKSSAITFTDKDGHSSRHAARGGLGAVMGAKGLKAIVIDDREAPSIELLDKESFRKAQKMFTELAKSDQQLQAMGTMGTPSVIETTRAIGSMPVFNYGSEPLDGVSGISGEALMKLGKERGGAMDPCMPGCVVGCSIVFRDAKGEHVTSSYEYETIALMGTNLGIVDPDVIARFDRIVDDIGIDTIELGSAMGVAASAGRMKMGDVDGAYKLLEEIEQGTEFGSVLGNGVVETCKYLGVDRVPAFKGQSMPAHDARATKATGVTYFTSPQGADHTAGVTYEDPQNPEGQVDRSLKIQIITAMADTLGLCILAAPTDPTRLLTYLTGLLKGRYGVQLSANQLFEIGKETLRQELKFNRGTDVETANPQPDWVRTEKLAPLSSVFDVDAAEIGTIWDRLDSARLVDSMVSYPYAKRYGTIKAIPEKGLDQEEIFGQLKEIAEKEDANWKNGKCSGTMYGGDPKIFEMIGRAFELYTHVNVLQRDLCPSGTRFESEIIAMTLDLLNGQAVKEHHPLEKACGVVGTGGTDSIISAVLAYRNKYREERGITQPEMIMPHTAHPAFQKGAHYFGVKLIQAPVDPATTGADVDFVKDHINANTIALVGTAGNYPYGTIDPIEPLSELALEHDIGMHVDGCLGGFILPYGEQLGYDIPVFDFRLPGVTSMSADTHKYAYGPKGTSVVVYRDKSFRKYQYSTSPEWVGGTYVSPGIGGSRSGGIIAATWAVMVTLGKEGYRERARQIFEAAFAMQKAVTRHPELRLMGSPTFCFSFTSDEFDIYHLNDFMKDRGWRFNGQQYPSALHMCVTGPQTQPGLVELFDTDIADAVVYAKNPDHAIAKSGALYGGAGSKAMVENADINMIRDLMIQYTDDCLEQPDE